MSDINDNMVVIRSHMSDVIAHAPAGRLGAMSESQQQQAAKARWDHPRVLCQGELHIGTVVLPCFVLDDERRVLSQRGLAIALGMKPGGHPNQRPRMMRFTEGKAIAPFVSDELRAAVNEPIEFLKEDSSRALGYEATILADLCNAVFLARKAGVLQPQQLHIADRCETLMMGFARVGLIALVDEATGFQYARERRALAEILKRFIAENLSEWVKTFPDDYYKEMFRLRGIAVGEVLTQRPRFFGGLTNEIVYKRLAPAVLEELQRKNPRTGKSRRTKHHQWLTRDVGHPKLTAHLSVVVALMKLSNDWDSFIDKLDRVAAKYNHTISLPFWDEADESDHLPP